MPGGHEDIVVTPVSTGQFAGMLWFPKEGKFTHGFRSNLKKKGLSELAVQQNIDKASSILGRGVKPNTQRTQQRTGLVVGYVQSGKTLSYTTVISMAKDNGFDLVIVVAGITTILLEQTSKRIYHDLSVNDEKNYGQWFPFNFSSTQDIERDKRRLRNVLDGWRSESDSIVRKTILVTVLKNNKHLDKLLNLLQEFDLTDVPTLIIDDEADQASLNRFIKTGKESAIYQRLTQIRKKLSFNTFLQYTATPQAPLLIDICDILSPDFVEVLEPGEDYVGGKFFFNCNQKEYVHEIPDDEIIVTDNELGDPPISLLNSLQIFLIGVAAGLIEGRSVKNPNRTMLVHPAREIKKHQEFKEWIINILDDWKELMNAADTERDKKDLIEEFQQAYTDLSSTAKDIPSFEEIKSKLRSVFLEIDIEVVNNTTKSTTPTIEWNSHYGWILIGGQALERGYTVKGLTITYMSRGAGIGNADTIQQRGRFFGYIGQFLGFCRIYLETKVLKAFVNYVEHEEDVRKQLCYHRDTGQSLDELRRIFLLSSELKPCRSSIIDAQHTHTGFVKWFSPQFVLSEKNTILDNQNLISKFTANLDFHSTNEDNKQHDAQTHQICESVPFQDVFEKLLVPFSFNKKNIIQRTKITGLLFQLSKVRDKYPEEKCTIYKMSPGYEREREVYPNDKIKQLYQGRAPVQPKESTGTIYRGDKKYKKTDELTVQIHSVNLRCDGILKAKAVPILAIWIPKRMKIDWYAQDRNKSS